MGKGIDQGIDARQRLRQRPENGEGNPDNGFYRCSVDDSIAGSVDAFVAGSVDAFVDGSVDASVDGSVDASAPASIHASDLPLP